MKFIDRISRRDRLEEVFDLLLERLPVFSGLEGDEVRTLRKLSGEFLRKKQLYPVEGVELTDELAASVAMLACLPILYLGIECYREFATIVLAQDEFYADSTDVDAAGVVHEIVGPATGQVLEYGSMVLSVADIGMAGRGAGYNVVIHEMIHVIDRLDGLMDGVPPLRASELSEWQDVFAHALSDFQRKARRRSQSRGSHRSAHDGSAGAANAPRGRTERGATSPELRRLNTRHRSRIDPYAAESPEEFFAVTCEVFFEAPWTLRREYRDVYRLYCSFFEQDPAERRRFRTT